MSHASDSFLSMGLLSLAGMTLLKAGALRFRVGCLLVTSDWESGPISSSWVASFSEERNLLFIVLAAFFPWLIAAMPRALPSPPPRIWASLLPAAAGGSCSESCSESCLDLLSVFILLAALFPSPSNCAALLPAATGGGSPEFVDLRRRPVLTKEALLISPAPSNLAAFPPGARFAGIATLASLWDVVDLKPCPPRPCAQTRHTPASTNSPSNGMDLKGVTLCVTRPHLGHTPLDLATFSRSSNVNTPP
mmetsp:Transcript_24379/g.52242  ORF Transcript_24379/g.52242 Transcript_24379/m.52242 type:complete len:249 (+) Transcript_24379:492-1238(+)